MTIYLKYKVLTGLVLISVNLTIKNSAKKDCSVKYEV
jgi:hypothetical protein